MTSYDPIEEYIEQEHEEWFLLALEEYLSSLKPRSRAIMKARNLPEKIPYCVIASHYGISSTRVRTIYKTQLFYMRVALGELESNYKCE